MKLEELYFQKGKLITNIEIMQGQLSNINKQIAEILTGEPQQPVIEKKDNSEIIKDPKKEEKKKS